MHPWMIVLIVLFFAYRRALPDSAARSEDAFMSGASSGAETPGWYGGLAERFDRRSLSSLLLRMPLALLVVFAVYFFFIQGYSVRVRAQPTIMSTCNVGWMTIQGSATADTVYLKAGLLTIEGFGNYDLGNNILNVNANVCGFTLTVPTHTNVNLSGNDAGLTVTGVTGNLELDNNAGDITIDSSTLLAGSTVSNNAGTITIDSSTLLAGSSVSNNGGGITITHSALGPNVEVMSNGSPVHITSSAIDGSSLSSGIFQIDDSTLTGPIQIDGQTTAQGGTLSNATISADSESISFKNTKVNGSVEIIGSSNQIGFVGTIKPGSAFTIVDDHGNDSITLPASLAIHLSLSGISSFTSDYPELQALDPTTLASSDGIQVNIGLDPDISVTVQGPEETLALNRTA